MKAYPTQGYEGDRYGGMDLRDYFAAHAMQALVSNKSINGEFICQANWLGEFSYKLADEMMRARNAK